MVYHVLCYRVFARQGGHSDHKEILCFYVTLAQTVPMGISLTGPVWGPWNEHK